MGLDTVVAASFRIDAKSKHPQDAMNSQQPSLSRHPGSRSSAITSITDNGHHAHLGRYHDDHRVHLHHRCHRIIIFIWGAALDSANSELLLDSCSHALFVASSPLSAGRCRGVLDFLL